jgi:tRNA threonylcarbamoyladenosine biosynthesis protein TsaB
MVSLSNHEGVARCWLDFAALQGYDAGKNPLIRPAGTFSHGGRRKRCGWIGTGPTLAPRGRGWIARQRETGEGAGATVSIILPITLAIDTAAPRLQLALLRRDGMTDISVDDMATGHAEIIFDRIAALLGRNGLGYPDLERVVTTTGPGSFTGLRIGLSAARGIGLARSIPVVGASSLVALSLTAIGPVTVLLDARRGEAYFQTFANAADPITPGALIPIEDARDRVLPGSQLVDTPFIDIAALARYGATLDPATHSPEPNYIRDADAKPQTAARIARQGA